MRKACWTLVVLSFGATTLGCGASDTNQSAHGGAGGASSPRSSVPIDSCALLSQTDIAKTVGNQVGTGQPFAGPEVCTWEAEPSQVSVLLTVRAAGSDREKVLCSELGKGGGTKQRLDGSGNVAIWKFSNTMGLFNSGELETCSGKGYVGLTLNGKRDEAQLKEAAVTLAQTVLKAL